MEQEGLSNSETALYACSLAKHFRWVHLLRHDQLPLRNTFMAVAMPTCGKYSRGRHLKVDHSVARLGGFPPNWATFVYVRRGKNTLGG